VSAARRAVSSAAAAALALAATASGEPIRIRLDEAMAIAVDQNPELRAARARADAEQLRGEAAGRRVWPRASASGEWLRTDTPARVFASRLDRGEFTADDFAIPRLNDPDALSHVTTALSIEWPVDVSGGLRARTRAEAAIARAARAEVDEAVQDVRLGVASAYLRAGLARQAAVIAAQAAESARAREADLQARVDEGLALRADLLRARARRRQRGAEVVAAEAETRVALASLARILGAAPQATFEPAEEPPPVAGLEGGESAWIARALAQRSRRRALAERHAAADWSARGERRGALPELSVYGQLQDDRSPSRGQASSTLGLMLRWSAFDGSRAKRIAAAEAERRAAVEDERAAADEIRLEVESAWRRSQAATERHQAAAGGAEEGREALRVVQERRQAGRATLTDELETEAASLAAALEERRVAVEAALAQARLRRAAGEL
jgi:outer membrane protein TolC